VPGDAISSVGDGRGLFRPEADFFGFFGALKGGIFLGGHQKSPPADFSLK
jgi:hypothetical protein